MEGDEIEKVMSFEAVLRDLMKERYFTIKMRDKILKFQRTCLKAWALLIIISAVTFFLYKTGMAKLLSVSLMSLGNGILLAGVVLLKLLSNDLVEFARSRRREIVYPVKEWATPISIIPEQSIHPFHIEKMIIKRGQKMGMEWGGHSHCIFLKDTAITILREGKKNQMDEKSVWMSDTPQEYFTHWNLVIRTKGPNILIAGLGLGLLVHLLALRRDIERIVIVEIRQEIIEMVSPYLPKKPEIIIINGDFFDIINNFLNSEEKFDTIICDIWKGIDADSRVTFNKCRAVVEECYPEAVHLFWAFQTIYEQEEALLFINKFSPSN